MFVQKVTSTPFVTGNARDFFRNTIQEVNSGADASFISTLRALLYQRIGDKKLRVRYTSSKYSIRDIESATLGNLVEYMLSCNPNNHNNTIFVHSISGEAPDRNAHFKRIKERFTRVYPSFERVQKVTDFFRKSFLVICYIDQENRNVILFVDKMTLRKFHAIQSAVFAFLPWFFNPDEGVTKDELELIQSLQEKTPDKYNEVIARMFSAIDIRSTLIKRSLKGFEAKYDRRTIESLEDEIANDNSIIDRYLRDIATKSRSVQDKMFRVNTLKERVSNTENEVMDYFLRNKNLDLVSVDDSSAIFNVRGRLVYFDEENAKKCIENRHSFVYDFFGHNNYSKEDFKKLMTAIFVDQTLYINVCSTFVMNLNGGISAVRGGSYDSSTYGDYTPNPHIYYFACLGGNEEAIANIIREGNLVGAIEQCCAANSSINFNDGAVMGRFMNTLCGGTSNNIKCIQLPTGDVVTPEQAIKWLNENEMEEVANE